MQSGLMKRAVIGSIVFSLAAMGVIFYLSSGGFSDGGLFRFFDKGKEVRRSISVSPVESAQGESGQSGDGQASPDQAVPEKAGDVAGQGQVKETGAEDAQINETIEEAQADGAGADESQPDGTGADGVQANNTHTGEAQRIETQPQDGAGEQAKDGQELSFSRDGADTSYLRIPLPKGCGADEITVENHYMDQELWVLLSGASCDFYEGNAISGNRSMVAKGVCESLERGVRLRLMLKGFSECRTILEDNDLYVSFVSPREIYDKIVVIDPACGGHNLGYEAEGLMEKEVNLRIVEKLKTRLDETDIKAYYTRLDDVNPGEEDRVRLANESKADMYIRIQVDASADSALYGTTAVYNGDYFIPGFGGVELADILEREIVTSIKGKALGLVEAEDEEYAIKNVTVPAAAIKVGCITNKQEAILLGREDYQDRIAEGIYNAIIKIYEEEQ